MGAASPGQQAQPHTGGCRSPCTGCKFNSAAKLPRGEPQDFHSPEEEEEEAEEDVHSPEEAEAEEAEEEEAEEEEAEAVVR